MTIKKLKLKKILFIVYKLNAQNLNLIDKGVKLIKKKEFSRENFKLKKEGIQLIEKTLN